MTLTHSRKFIVDARRLSLFVLTGFSILLAGCGNMPGANKGGVKDGDPSEKKFEKPTIIIPVEVASPTRGPISEYHQTSSRVEAETSVMVTSKGSGLCLEVLVDEGDTVERGAVLARLDKTEAQASLSEAEIQSMEAQAAFDRAERSKSLGIISQQDYDATYFTYERAKETVTMRKVQLNDMTIRAPWSGVITSRLIQPGGLVSTGTESFGMVDPLSFVLAIQVPERIVTEVHVGQEAQVTIDAVADRSFQARVRRINPSVDRETGKVKVLLDFEEDARAYMREAAFARVDLVMATRENALLVPKDSVLEENTRRFVFVVRPAEDDGEAEVAKADAVEPEEKDSSSGKEVLASPVDAADTEEDKQPPLTAVRLDVEVGLENSDHFEVVSGLTDDDLVVFNGHHSLVSSREGTRVRVTNATDEILKKAGLSTEDALAAAAENRTDDAGGMGGKGGGKGGGRMHRGK